MYKEYVFGYRVPSLPYWFTFVTYAENETQAESNFLQGIDVTFCDYRLKMINNI